MTGTLRHFSINADDLARARAFYETVFGWTFEPWGPPGFYVTGTSGRGPTGSLQGRRSVAGVPMPGLEITFAVDDIKATVSAIEAQGGRILMPPSRIETVGVVSYFQDTEGNVAGACQYDRESGR